MSDLLSSDTNLDDTPERDDSELDEKSRAIRTEKRRKNLQKEKGKQRLKKNGKPPTPTKEVEPGEAGADKGFDDIDRPSKRDK